MSAKLPETAPFPAFPGGFKYTPIEQLRNLFVGFTQGLFDAAPPGCYHWDPDDSMSEIVIRDESPVKEEVIAKRPLITFTRGPIQFYSLGLDDMANYQFDTGKKTKSVLVPGTMTMNCCSRVPQEAENISWVVMEHLWLLRELLLKAGLFEVGRQPQMGSPSPAGSIIADGKGDEFICVPVSLPFQFVRTAAFTPLGNQIVQNIENTLAARFPGLRCKGPPPVGSHELPVSVNACPPEPYYGATDVHGQTPDPGRQRTYFLPKQTHPLNPARTVHVRTVRPYCQGLRPYLAHGSGQVPIPTPCVEESQT